jgi:hypothetical protein
MFLRHGADPDEELDDEITEGGELVSLPHAVMFGVPFPFRALLQGRADVLAGQTARPSAAFEASLTGLTVLDEQMHPVSSFTVVASSGTTYPVPGPPGWGVLIGLAGRRRRR